MGEIQRRMFGEPAEIIKPRKVRRVVKSSAEIRAARLAARQARAKSTDFMRTKEFAREAVAALDRSMRRQRPKTRQTRT